MEFDRLCASCHRTLVVGMYVYEIARDRYCQHCVGEKTLLTEQSIDTGRMAGA